MSNMPAPVWRLMFAYTLMMAGTPLTALAKNRRAGRFNAYDMSQRSPLFYPLLVTS